MRCDQKVTFSTILECLETLGHFGSVWVIWVLWLQGIAVFYGFFAPLKRFRVASCFGVVNTFLFYVLKGGFER